MTADSVYWFRQCAPYVHLHRGKTVVILLTGESLRDSLSLSRVQDIALIHSLGLRVVLVFGARPQIDDRCKQAGVDVRFHRGMRVTDSQVLDCVTEAVGRIRTELEAQLSLALIHSPLHGSDLRVCSGNFVVARPVGVVDGVDLCYTGVVRRVRADDIRAQLDRGQLILIPTLGYAITGEVFNVACEDLASSLAIALGAEKLILFGPEAGILDEKENLIRELAPTEAMQRVDPQAADSELSRRIVAACRAIQNGVRRAHILGYREEGAILQELFTRDGCGTLVSDNDYDQLRWASAEDLGGIRRLITPLEERGVLVPRPPEKLLNEIGQYVVEDRDGLIVSCAALHFFEAEHCVEMACVAVDPRYRGTGRGDRILGYAIRKAREAGMQTLFVLTTQTAHWFVERGFREAGVGALPITRQQMYNLQRNSKVFILDLLSPAPAGS